MRIGDFEDFNFGDGVEVRPATFELWNWILVWLKKQAIRVIQIDRKGSSSITFQWVKSWAG